MSQPSSPSMRCRQGPEADAGARLWTKERPQPIDNQRLLEAEVPDRLRQGIFEHLDFELLPAETWALLHGWYGGGPPVARQAIRLPSGGVRVELCQLGLRACTLADRRNFKHIEVSRVTTVGMLRKRLCEEFGCGGDRAVRLWRHPDEEQHESLEGKDELTLEACRIIEGQIILLEEQRPGCVWPLDCSNSPMADACTDEPGRPSTSGSQCRLTRRAAGMSNLGNTCFMNSSIQCLANIPCLRDYFLTEEYCESVEVDSHRTEQTQGRLASGFAELLQTLWGSTESFAPWKFKELVQEFAEQFSGYRQHDSMEFVEFIIDGLKEDCNRIKGKKPYSERPDANGRPDATVALEAGNRFLLRNDSYVDDLFVGFMKSVTTCPEPSCGRESIVFDPFLSVKVPVASPRQSSERPFCVTVVPLATSLTPITKHRIPLDRYGNTADLISAASKEAKLPAESCVLIEACGNKVHKFFEGTEKLEDISSLDMLVLYELEDVSAFELTSEERWGSWLTAGDMVVTNTTFWSSSTQSHRLDSGLPGRVAKVDGEGDALIKFDGIEAKQWVLKHSFHHLELLDVSRDVRQTGAILHFRRVSSTALRGERRELLGLPLLLSMRRDLTAGELVKMLREELARRFGDAAVATADGGECRIYQAETGRSVLMTDLRLDTAAPDKVLGLHSREYLVVEWEDGPPHQVLEALAEGEHQLDLEDEVPLERCFEWFTESEQLSEYDAVYCSGCKDHRQSFKRLEFWSLPPVLILQLKRFEFTGVQRRRLSTQVRFPLEGLDLGRFCLSDSESFPRGACLRAGRPARVTGLQSAKGSKLNGTTVVVRFFNTQSGRFCANGLGNGDGGGIKLKPENLVPVPRAGERPRAPELVFDLTAISTHIGDARFGHYKAYVRSSEDGHWRCFDDDRVQEVPPDAVEALRSEAYLLFYVRRDHRPRSWGPPPAPACA